MLIITYLILKFVIFKYICKNLTGHIATNYNKL